MNIIVMIVHKSVLFALVRREKTVTRDKYDKQA